MTGSGRGIRCATRTSFWDRPAAGGREYAIRGPRAAPFRRTIESPRWRATLLVMLSRLRRRSKTATVTAWRRASFIGIAVAGVIVIGVTVLTGKEFWDAFLSNFLVLQRRLLTT